jgi:hypothetical protein
MLTQNEIENEIIKMYRKHPIMRDIQFKVRDRTDQLSRNYSKANLKGFKGTYQPRDRMILISGENHRDIKDLQETLKHEIYGHAATYMINRADKEKLINSIKSLENEPGVKEHWESVKKGYVGYTRDMQAEEVFAYIAEKSKDGYTLVSNVTYEVKSLEDIQKAANHIKNEMLSGRARFLFRPERNNEQFRKPEHAQEKSHSPETLKQFVKQRSEHAQIKTKENSKGVER